LSFRASRDVGNQSIDAGDVGPVMKKVGLNALMKIRTAKCEQRSGIQAAQM